MQQRHFILLTLCFWAGPTRSEPVDPALTPPLPVYLCQQCTDSQASQLARQHYRAIAICRYELTARELAGKVGYAQLEASELTDPFVEKPAEFYQAAATPEQQYCADVSQGLLIADPHSHQLWWYHNRNQNIEQQLAQPLPPEQKPVLAPELQLKTAQPQLAQAVQQLVVYSQQLLQLQQQVTAELQQTWQPTRINQARLQSQLQLMFGEQAAGVCPTDPSVSLLANGMQPFLQQQLTVRWQSLFASQSASRQLVPWQEKLQFNQRTVSYLLPEITQEISALQLHWPQTLQKPTLTLQHSGNSWQWQMSYRPDWYADFHQDWPHHRLNGQPFSLLLGTSQAAASVVNPCWLPVLALHYDSIATAATADEAQRWRKSDEAATARQLMGHTDNRVCRYQLVSHDPQLPTLRPLLSICPSP